MVAGAKLLVMSKEKSPKPPNRAMVELKTNKASKAPFLRAETLYEDAVHLSLSSCSAGCVCADSATPF